MTIYVGSRYENDPVDRVITPSGSFLPAVYHSRPPEIQTFGYAQHICGYGERMETLAAEYLRDSELYWIIANANPEVFYPDDIPVGTVLRIPDARVLG